MAPIGCTYKARAKINLSLHVEGLRGDGYHELSGLVAFSQIADEVQFEVSRNQQSSTDDKARWPLQVVGPFASRLRAPCSLASENLVSKAVRLYCAQAEKCASGTITLHKNLPIAAGIGGGSSDAAATLNAMQQINSSPLSDDQLFEIALEIGADVPMCLKPSAQMISGIGEVLRSVTNFPPLPAVLVNPGVGVSTPAVFQQLAASQLSRDTARTQTAPADLQTPMALVEWLRQQRNDLQAPAIGIAPVIGDVLDELAKDNNCHLARMSGSGATCFGLYDSTEAAQEAARRIKAVQPGWWAVATMLS